MVAAVVVDVVGVMFVLVGVANTGGIARKPLFVLLLEEVEPSEDGTLLKGGWHSLRQAHGQARQDEQTEETYKIHLPGGLTGVAIWLYNYDDMFM